MLGIISLIISLKDYFVSKLAGSSHSWLMVAMTILKPFWCYFLHVVSHVAKMSGSRAPVKLEFCYHDAAAGFLVPVVLSLGFAVTLIHIFSCISESMQINYPKGLFWMWSQIGPNL